MRVTLDEYETLECVLERLGGWAKEAFAVILANADIELTPKDLRDCLKNLKITQKQFAKEFGISPQYLGDFLAGRREFPIERHREARRLIVDLKYSRHQERTP